ncbi:hypothetical protein CH341_13145 [Rhodoplanes roseus]|uniref:Uncharacterized protein n=2 Tax=Rhodoplanes roseus TaxID=29409 RepID=A0A327KZJ9_9BRAD|nr:hypothetical protein CH341_13145 [Rhodoplanes roseus]
MVATGLGLGVMFGPAAAGSISTPGGRFSLQQGSNVGTSPVSKDALGRPCADIEAAARPHSSNPNVFDHVVSVVNRCLKPLKLSICYFGSVHCQFLDIPGTRRKDLVLGVYPGMKTFRYSYKEVR